MKWYPFSLTPDRKLPKEPVATNGTRSDSDMWWTCANIEKSGVSPKMMELHNLLLEIGGTETVLPVVEEDLDKILERGYYLSGKSRLMLGKPSRCHENAANLWESNRDKDVRIMTGYALSEDGFWRQHSWLLQRYQTATQKRIRIIETTVKRLAYLGFEMTEDEAEEFAYNN